MTPKSLSLRQYVAESGITSQLLDAVTLGRKGHPIQLPRGSTGGRFGQERMITQGANRLALREFHDVLTGRQARASRWKSDGHLRRHSEGLDITRLKDPENGRNVFSRIWGGQKLPGAFSEPHLIFEQVVAMGHVFSLDNIYNPFHTRQGFEIKIDERVGESYKLMVYKNAGSDLSIEQGIEFTANTSQGYHSSWQSLVFPIASLSALIRSSLSLASGAEKQVSVTDLANVVADLIILARDMVLSSDKFSHSVDVTSARLGYEGPRVRMTFAEDRTMLEVISDGKRNPFIFENETFHLSQLVQGHALVDAFTKIEGDFGYMTFQLFEKGGEKLARLATRRSRDAQIASGGVMIYESTGDGGRWLTSTSQNLAARVEFALDFFFDQENEMTRKLSEQLLQDREECMRLVGAYVYGNFGSD